MGFARLAAIGMIALTMVTQTGWGQNNAMSEQAAEQARQQRERATEWAERETARIRAEGTLIPTDSRPRISVDFPGGTIGEYVAALRKASPVANIVVSREAAGMSAPEIVLREVTLEVAASAVEFQREEGDVWEAVQVAGMGSGGNGNPTAFRIDYRKNQRSSSTAPKQDASAWSVADLLSSGYESDQVLAAIQVGQALFGEAATIKYHEPTKLLVARGTSEQLSLISRTLDQLRTGRPGNDAEAAIRQDIARNQKWFEQMNAELEPVQTRLVEVRRLIQADDAGQRRLSAADRGELESEMRNLEQQRDSLLERRRQAEMNIRQAESRLQVNRSKN